MRIIKGLFVLFVFFIFHHGFSQVSENQSIQTIDLQSVRHETNQNSIKVKAKKVKTLFTPITSNKKQSKPLTVDLSSQNEPSNSLTFSTKHKLHTKIKLRNPVETEEPIQTIDMSANRDLNNLPTNRLKVKSRLISD